MYSQKQGYLYFLFTDKLQRVTFDLVIQKRFTRYNFYMNSANRRTLANTISFKNKKSMCKSCNVIIVINKLPLYYQ